MVRIVPEREADGFAREALLDRTLGSRRRAKTSERLREGRLSAEGLAFAARDDADRLIGTLRFWNIDAGTAGPALLLGPLAVDGDHQGNGLGAALLDHGIAEAKRLGHRAIVLVGDEPFYGRFGFTRAAAGDLRLPGPLDLSRFVGLELAPGALVGARGLVTASGRSRVSVGSGWIAEASTATWAATG